MTSDGRRARALEVLEELGNQPATSYYEAAVARVVERVLHDAHIPYETDAYGNIIAHYTPTVTSTQRPVAMVAHMDHPGFEIVEVDGGTGTARMLGRTSDAVYTQQVALLIHGADGNVIHGRTSGTNGSPEERIVGVELDGDVELPAYAVFDLPGVDQHDGTIHMRACDDLAGCAAALTVLEALVVNDATTEVYGVFTRAEEEGLIGARLLAEESRLPPKTLVISVESSRSLPGAEHGQGPIIRVGDAVTTFSMSAEILLLAARQRLMQRDPPIRVQRQLMSGGVCEASVFILHGYDATGIAFPLGHYHNGFGEDSVQAEFIAVSDFLGGTELLFEAVQYDGTETPPVFGRLQSQPEAEAARLRESSHLR